MVLDFNCFDQIDPNKINESQNGKRSFKFGDFHFGEFHFSFFCFIFWKLNQGDQTLIFPNDLQNTNKLCVVDDTADTEALLNNIESMLKSMQNQEDLNKVKQQTLQQQQHLKHQVVTLTNSLRKKLDTEKQQQQRRQHAVNNSQSDSTDPDVLIIKEEPLEVANK